MALESAADGILEEVCWLSLLRNELRRDSEGDDRDTWFWCKNQNVDCHYNSAIQLGTNQNLSWLIHRKNKIQWPLRCFLLPIQYFLPWPCKYDIIIHFLAFYVYVLYKQVDFTLGKSTYCITKTCPPSCYFDIVIIEDLWHQTSHSDSYTHLYRYYRRSPHQKVDCVDESHVAGTVWWLTCHQESSNEKSHVFLNYLLVPLLSLQLLAT